MSRAFVHPFPSHPIEALNSMHDTLAVSLNMHRTLTVEQSVWFNLGSFWMVSQVELLGNDVFR